MTTNKELICYICNKNFTLINNLNRHLKNIHRIRVVPSKPKHHKCSVCNMLFSYYRELREHLTSAHNIEIKTEIYTFKDKKDFVNWKEQIQKELKCSYIQQRGTRKGKKSYYLCHRSYRKLVQDSCSSSTPTKKLKSKGSSKLEYTCPSTIEFMEGTKCEAKLFLPHVGHSCSLKDINLTKKERTEIAGKIAEGVSSDKILEDIQNSIVSEVPLERIHLLDKQDLRNIKKEFSLNNNIQIHKNDEHLLKNDCSLKLDQTLLQPELFNRLADHNKQKQLKEDLIKKTKLKLDLLYAHISNYSVDDETIFYIGRAVDNILNKVENIKQKIPLKITKQRQPTKLPKEN